MNILLNDPPRSRREGKTDFVNFGTLLAESDIVTVHVPLSFVGEYKTYQLFNEKSFNKLKKGTWFINTSRGEVTDTASLKKALETGRLGGAVLDVWENEPDIDMELATLEKEKGRLEKSIQSNNNTVAKENDNLAIQNDELTTVSAGITDNNSQLSTMDDGPAKDERIKYIKDLEKRKKKALSSIEASENKIKNAENDTFRANSEIPRNESMQDSVKERIVQQEMVVQKFTDKLANIKLY